MRIQSQSAAAMGVEGVGTEITRPWDFERSRGSIGNLLADSRIRSGGGRRLSLQRDRLPSPGPGNCCARSAAISMQRRLGKPCESLALRMTVGRTFYAKQPSSILLCWFHSLLYNRWPLLDLICRQVKELEMASKSDLVRAAGYVSTRERWHEAPELSRTSTAKALLEAKGLSFGDGTSKGTRQVVGRSLS